MPAHGSLHWLNLLFAKIAINQKMNKTGLTLKAIPKLDRRMLTMHSNDGNALEQSKSTIDFLIKELVKTRLEASKQRAENQISKAKLMHANKQIMHDQLTKLPNRRLFDDRFNQAVLVSKRSQSYLALLFMDLDGFKYINDTWGHLAGDHYLIGVAERMKYVIRDSDTIARFGGDEFMLLIKDLAFDPVEALMQAKLIADKLRIAVIPPVSHTHQENDPFFKKVHKPSCTVSIGGIVFTGSTKHKIRLDDMIEKADKSMYEVKKNGGNQICIEAL